jgi:molybdate transport system substrate-binding protein
MKKWLSLVGLVAGLGLLVGCGHRQRNKEPLLCYVSGTMRPALEALAKDYEKQTGQRVELDYAGSGELLIKIGQTRRGDLYICHDPFMAAAELQGFVKKSWVLASVTPVIVVPKGNPKHIKGLRDLARPGMRVVLTHAEYSTTGHLVARMTEKAGIKLGSNVVSRTRGGGAAANAVMLGTADAAIVWDAVAYLRREKLDAVPIEPDVRLKRGVDAITTATFKRIEMAYIKVSMATLTVSKQPTTAEKFAEFVAAAKNRKVWDSFGFSPPDKSREKPDAKSAANELLVMCAAGMRLPVSEMAREFEKEHGIKIVLAYDGSNRLLGNIKLARKGDIYIAGDVEYIKMAKHQNLAGNSVDLCLFEPVIMVRKGNPKRIKELSDLAKPGIRVGLADEKAAAIGRLMPELLKQNGVDRAALQKNIVMTTATVNELALAVKLGTVDAVVVWDCIANKYDADIVEIAENICPEVGACVLACSQNRSLANDFLDFMDGKRGQEILRKNGYKVPIKMSLERACE